MDTVQLEAGVEAEVLYVQPQFTHSYHYVGDGQAVNTAAFDRHRVFIRDARRAHEPLGLEASGFELVPHATRADLYDETSVVEIYRAEIEKVLMEVTGADRVALFNWKRRDVAHATGNVYNAATDVHVDSDAAASRLRAVKYLEQQHGESLDRYSRFMNINAWRALSRPPQDRPLAVCHGASVSTQAGAPNRSMRVAKMPAREDMLKERPNDAQPDDGLLFHHDPAHRWYYYPNMTPDELLLFKLYDSRETGAWRCPHVSFLDGSAKDPAPRESYEIRSVCYFR